MPRNTVYELTITTHSPVHIATGQQLVQDFDFIYDESNRITYVVDAEVALLVADQVHQRREKHLKQRIRQFSDKAARQQTEVEENKLRIENDQLRALGSRLWNGLPLDQLLEKKLLTLRDLEARPEIDGKPLVRYILHGDLSRSDNINAQIKDVYGRPYIPGSSLKGAIRTALAWQHFSPTAANIPLPYPTGPKDRGKNADDRFEQVLFVIKPSLAGKEVEAVRDVLRMLQVRDSSAASAEQLYLAPVRVFGPKQAADVLNVEAIRPATVFTTGIQIEQYAFEAPAARERGLNYQSKRGVLEQIAQACREFGQSLIQHEIEYYSVIDSPVLRQFYQQMAQELRGFEETSFFLPLGWGTGWHTKTYGDHLQQDKEKFAELVHDYQLDEPIKRKPSQFEPGDRFPVTRKIVLNNQKPWHPLGWVRIDMIEVQR